MAKTIKIKLGVSSLEGLSKQLKAYKTKMKAVDGKIVETLVGTGTTILEQNLAAIPKYDGNEPGVVDTYLLTHTVGPSVGVISNYGPQVVFLEFGTGIRGQASPHPQHGDIGYNYNLKLSEHAHRMINGVEGWFYKPVDGDKALFTAGIVPSMQMWNTALALRRIYIPISKQLIKQVW